MARQHKIDEGVKAQLQAHLRSIESLCQSLVMKPEGIEFSFLVDDFKAFAARARESDIPTALSVAETAAIFTAGVAMRNTAVALENNLVPNAELSPLQSAWTKWHAFSAGVTCARTSAILGDIEAYVAFRTIMGDLVMDLIIDEMRNANAYPSWDKHGLLRDMDTLEADAVVIRKSSPDFQPPEIITLLPKDIPEKT